MAPLPDLDVERIRRYCASRLPEKYTAEWPIECTVRGKSVTLFDCRAPWSEDIGPEWTRVPIAQLRFDPPSARWRIYWPDRNSRWHPYDEITPGTVDEMLAEIESDPTSIFWG